MTVAAVATDTETPSAPTSGYASLGPILLVDDDKSRAEFVQALEHLAWPLAHAATGERAIEAAERERPTAVVAEVLLPGISGYELCRVLKDRYGSGLPVIFVSGRRTHPADRVAGLLIGADDYLVKPVHPDELLVRVRRLIEPGLRSGVARARLTLREEEVLQLLTDGLHQREIAGRLVITPRTVAKHVEHILYKLGVHTRAQAVAVALRDQHPRFRVRQ
jgi:two-component system nitrate/nitrite response regulator NarL